MVATGGCLCGAVRFRIEGEPLFMGFCHCRDCQRSTGTGHAAGMSFRRKDVHIEGETRSYSVTGSSGLPIARRFCPACGSSLFTEPGRLRGMINISAGVLDDPVMFQPQAAIFTRDRQPWDRTSEGLPAYEAAPPRRPD